MSSLFPRGTGSPWHSLAAAWSIASLVAVPLVAEAQSPADRYIPIVQAQDYEPLPLDNGENHYPVVFPSMDEAETVLGLPFPVQFFGQTFYSIRVGTNIVASFTDPVYSGYDHIDDTSFPQAAPPNNLIAPWWDDANCEGGGVEYQFLENRSPRQYVIQWSCWTVYHSDPVPSQVQLWFTEGSNVIETRYGIAGTGDESVPNMENAVVGLENADGTIGIAPVWGGATESCSGRCTKAEFPEQTAILYAQDDLVLTRLVADPQAAIGNTVRVTASARWDGAADVADVRIRFWLSTDGVVDEGDLVLGETAPRSFTFREAHTFQEEFAIPLDVELGTYYVLAQVDADGLVEEANETNNTRFSDPVVVRPPSVDMFVAEVRIGIEPQDDGFVRFSWLAGNTGNVDGIQVPYRIVLSDNDFISTADRVIASGVINVPRLGETEFSEAIELPETLPAGYWWVGVILDPDGEVYEENRMNNTGVSPHSVLLTRGGLYVVTESLPDGEVAGFYCPAIEAAGGDGDYEWSIVGGTLPPGLQLDTSEGVALICGYPSTVADTTLTVQVRSGGVTATKDLQLRVLEPGMPLTLVTGGLPYGRHGLGYEAVLMAAGGQPPYEWVVSGELPPGLHAFSDGRIRGTPTRDGTYEIVVHVRDNNGAERSREFTIVIGAPQRLTCTTSSLPRLKLGEPIVEPLEIVALGGSGNYQFSSLEVRRIGNGSTDEGSVEPNAAPPGLVLREVTTEEGPAGQVTGTPAAGGRFLWQVEVDDTVTNETDVCIISLEVELDQGMTITTQALQDATINTPYYVSLAQSGGVAPITWKLAPGSTLPKGLDLGADGAISGIPAADLLEEGVDSRVFNFMVVARDAQNRLDERALSIRVKRPGLSGGGGGGGGKSDDGGCQSGAAAPSLLGFAFALWALRRRS